MSITESDVRISRRRALALGGGVAGGVLVSGAGSAGARTSRRRPVKAHKSNEGRLPVKKIEAIVGAEGSVSSGVLDISLDRDDIGTVSGPLGIPFTPAFQIHGDLTFQPLGHRRAFFNGDIALKPSETQAVIDAIHANGLAFQAFHQHYFDLDPMVWFIHFRGEGAPLDLARSVRAVIDATSAPLPQTMPSDPKTPLDAERLGEILDGDAQVEADGVVSVSVSRTDKIVIDDVEVSPEANISTTVAFQPLNSDGSVTAVGPDFSLEASEVDPVTRLMREQGWLIGCLYNQETDEHPQLYFAHMLAEGDPYDLARQVRKGLDLTDV